MASEWKHPDSMTVEECRDEAERLDSFFEDCERWGDGISTKDAMRHRLCRFKVQLFDELGVELPEGTDTHSFIQRAREMFHVR